MGHIVDWIIDVIKGKSSRDEVDLPVYEYCPNCDANLTLQKGYDSSLPYWVCLGCKEMLINPEIESDTAWICDNCGEMLNIQPGFTEECVKWVCSECGYVNLIDQTQLFATEDEYEADKRNPFKGLSDEDVLALSEYEDVSILNDKGNVNLVRDRQTGELLVRKVLEDYEKSIYLYLKNNPIGHMPKVKAIFESANCLIVIEEYIDGITLADKLENNLIEKEEAIKIVHDVCNVLDELHQLPTPIILRDIKPSNVIIKKDGDIFLLDMNVAKWYDPNENDDTRYMGTLNYAAPEQAGFGIKSSSTKTDIYAAGVLLNVMITGVFPKKEIPAGKVGEIIRKCISMDAENRYTARELLVELEKMGSGE